MDTIKPEFLENGNVLLNLKKQFLEKRDAQSLSAVLAVLRDSIIIIPATLVFSDVDKDKFINSSSGDEIKNEGDIHIKPDILKGPDDAMYFPIFSQKEQIPDDYLKDFSTVRVPALHAIEMAHGFDGVCGLVLDAFTDALVLPYELADTIKQYPSHLEEA